MIDVSSPQGVSMAAPTLPRPDVWPDAWPDPDPDRLLRIPMPYQDWLELPEGIRAEYVGGVAIVTPPATRGHQRVERRIANAIEAGLPGLDVTIGPGLTSKMRDHRIPDVAVFATFEDVSITRQVPIVVVEVLSRSTRSEDTIRKAAEYAADGIAQYWIVDRDQRAITVLSNHDGAWQIDLELDDAHARGCVSVGDRGEVDLDLSALLDR